MSGELSVKSITDGIMFDAWVALNRAAEAATEAFTGVALKQKLAWLPASAVVGAEGASRLSTQQAQLSDKSLHKQVDKVEKELKDISSKAERSRAAAAKADTSDTALQVPLPDVLAASQQKEQSDLASSRGRTSVTAAGFQKLLNTEPEPKATAAVAPDSEAAELEPLSPGQKCWQDFNAEQAEKAAVQLSANRGIPRALASELGEEGCAAVEKYLKDSGGVRVPTLGEDGHGPFVLATCENPHLVTTPYAGGSHLLSLTWEQALRHRLPEVLRHVAHVASETMFALNEYRACVPELQRLLQESHFAA